MTNIIDPYIIEQFDIERKVGQGACTSHNIDTSFTANNEEFAARARLKELINNAKTLQTKAEYTPKKVSNFDPASMNLAKRFEQRTKATYVDSEELNTSFKALPLPGNTPVRNNPLAMTKSFQQKIDSVDRLIRLDKDNHTASVMTSVKSTNDMSYTGYENEEEKEQARQVRAKKNLRKRNLLDEVNNLLLQEGSLGDDDTSILQNDIDRVEDPSVLTQQIAQLESKLKHEKTQRLATLNDIVDIDLSALFDRLIPEDAGEDAKTIIDHLKNKVYENVQDFDSYSVDSSQAEGLFIDTKSPTLFTRQEEWVKRRDQKRFEAKMQLEADTMRDITGKPELGNAKRSWVMAKEAHEEALERAHQNATPDKILSNNNGKEEGRELKVIDWQKAKESHDQALKRATQQEETKRKARAEKEKAAAMEEIQHLDIVKPSVAVESKTPKKKERLQSSFQSREALHKSSVQLIEFARSKSIPSAANDVSGESIRKMKSNINAFTEVKASEMSEREFRALYSRIVEKRNSHKKV